MRDTQGLPMVSAGRQARVHALSAGGHTQLRGKRRDGTGGGAGLNYGVAPIYLTFTTCEVCADSYTASTTRSVFR